ncbi:MAG: hypothetical protein MJ155_02655 [Candidatus Saccharibacteria bacterium]|nr:hypothetical protein [Candidatus Saccharibacteria bacterium]
MLFKLFHKNDDIIKDPIRVEPQQPTFRREEPQNTVMGESQMVIEDVFSIAGRGIVAIGKVSGEFRIDDEVLIRKTDGTTISSAISGLEAFRKTLNMVSDGYNCGILLRGIKRDQIERGDVIVKA